MLYVCFKQHWNHQAYAYVRSTYLFCVLNLTVDHFEIGVDLARRVLHVTEQGVHVYVGLVAHVERELQLLLDPPHVLDQNRHRLGFLSVRRCWG